MKIISGTLKGRTIKGYDIEGTRPTMDRVKESLFGTIQNKIRDSVVLDLFAGTGNLGFEAISNGAKFCYFNDHNKKCTSLIEKNIDLFSIKDNAKVFNFDYKKALKYFSDQKIDFDLVFLDPPYKNDCLNDVVNYVSENNLLKKDGLIICETSELYLNVSCFEKIKEKKYGDKYITIYKNNL